MTTLAEIAIIPAVNTDITKSRACPSWCDVEDHDDWGPDHSWCDTVDLSAYPYTVQGETYQDLMWVALRQARDNAPVIVIDGPGADRVGTLPDGVAERGDAILTLKEAAELVEVLQQAIMRGSLPGSTA